MRLKNFTIILKNLDTLNCKTYCKNGTRRKTSKSNAKTS